jgi:hypothetical protein
MKNLIASFVLVASVCLGGCSGSPLSIATPAGFAQLDDQQDYGYRATNAQGVVLAARREANEPYGDLTFWSGALDAHLRRAGYTADKSVDVASAAGLQGRQLRYTIERNGRDHAFWVTVFVTERDVVTIEAGGDAQFFDAAETSLTKAIASLHLG